VEKILVVDDERSLREVLSIMLKRAGYAVTEVPIEADSPLAHHTIRQSQLRERDIVILSIRRGGLVIPNPRGDRELLPGDMLLCYGKSLALKSIAPTRRGRKRDEQPVQSTAAPA